MCALDQEKVSVYHICNSCGKMQWRALDNSPSPPEHWCDYGQLKAFQTFGWARQRVHGSELVAGVASGAA